MTTLIAPNSVTTWIFYKDAMKLTKMTKDSTFTYQKWKILDFSSGSIMKLLWMIRFTSFMDLRLEMSKNLDYKRFV